MKYFTFLLSVLATPFLTGCFQTAVAVRLKSDGSGTIERVLTMSSTAVAQMKQMQSSAGGDSTPPPTEINEARLKADAEKFGEGVTFVSAKKLAIPQREGFVATYAFKDISLVKVSLNENIGGGGDNMQPQKKEEPITFQFKKGSPAELTVITPSGAKNEETKQSGDDNMNDQAMQMMKEIFKDMRISVVVDVQGTILKTNATYHQGQRVTLMDMEFVKLMADTSKFKALAAIKDPNSPEAKALLKTIPGVKMELENPVRISFK
jgi:hypothetical protein